MNLEIENTGFILYTRKFKDCIKFYKDVLGLKVMYTKEDLTCFEFGGSYLMVELGDKLEVPDVILNRDLTCLRINVKDVKKACHILDKAQITYSYNEFEWGTIAKFKDPDGNLIGFRSNQEHVTDQQNF